MTIKPPVSVTKTRPLYRPLRHVSQSYPLYRNAVNIQETARLGRKVNFAPGRILLGGNSPQNVHSPGPGDGQVSCKVWLTSVERRRCSHEAKMRKPLKFARVPQTRQPISAVDDGRREFVPDPSCCVTRSAITDRHQSGSCSHQAR